MDVSDEPDYIFDLYGEDSKNLVPLPPTACWPENWLKKTSNSSSSTTAVGINTATYPMTSKDKPKKPIRPPLRSFKTSNKEDCWKTPWSFGEENLDEPTTPKGCSNPTTTVEITTPLLYHLYGWCRSQKRNHNWCYRRFWLQHCRKTRTHSRFSGNTHAPAGH